MPARVVDGGFDLGAVANDAGVAHQARHVARAESGHDRRFEIAKGPAEVLPLAQDGQPAQAGHESFEAELLEESPVIG